jgi:Cytochrome c7 and related cytochrome c
MSKLAARAMKMLLASLLFVMLGNGIALGQGAGGSSSSLDFNHTTTGFPLTDFHARARCETCHIQGIFRGTPRDCASCHRLVGRVTGERMPITHIPTTLTCDTCHRTSGWAPAFFNHQGVGVGTCTTCHNSVNATGKPPTHLPTNSSCDSCHKQSAWSPAGYDHVSVAPGTCMICHNGARATGKPGNHIPTVASCDTCHAKPPASTAFSQARMNHTGMAGQCSTCHSGGYLAWNAQAKPATHIPTTAQCDACHNSTTSWATIPNPHSLVPAVATIGGGGCTSCHGVNAIGKPTNHIATAAQCDACHRNFVAFAPAQMDHAATTGPVSVGNCSTCHDGTKTFANALGKPATHIPTTAQCDTCHKNVVMFAPSMMDHTGTAGRCSTCHNGSYLSANAQTKPPTHVPTTAQCDSCHHSTTSWATVTFVHPATAVGTCSNCHNSINALGKPSNHIPTSKQCDTCHNNYFAFAPAAMNHVGLAGQCSGCHSGAYIAVNALARPPTHIPNPSVAVSQCDTCHTNGFVAFAPAVMNHSGMAGYCDKCHNGAFLAVNAQSKPPTHLITTAQCDSCHKSTVSWATATFDHSTASPPATGRCSTCHNGTTALGKSTNHIPTAAQCDVCHVGGFATFAPATMSHTGTTGPVATGNCSTCHSGAFNAQNAQSKPATHLPTTQQCDTCHTTIAFKPANFTHAVTDTNCSSCHNGTTATGKIASHIPTTAQCSVCHLNKIAFAPAVMSHTGTTGPISTGNCSTCHGGAYIAVNAQTKPPTHVLTTAQCDSCHNSTVSWATATFNHATASPPVTGRCSTCHNGTAALGKPTNHIPTAAQCDVCHTNTSYVSFTGTGQMNHPATSGPVATANCSTCHNGGYLTANALKKPATHIPTNGQCDTCHKNYVAFNPATMSHTGTAGQCASCHNGSYLAANAQAKSATHVPTTQSCDVCHKITTAWIPASFAHTGVVAGSCATCHNGTNASGKSTPHIPTTLSCDACHRTGIAWLPLITPFAHTGVAAGTCATCHGGGFPNIDTKTSIVPNHVPTTASCDACHRTTAWVPHTAYNHSGIAAGTCATCHGSSLNYAGVVKPPSNHFFDSTMSLPGLRGPECSNCHSSTSSFVTERMNHGSIQTSCATCHSSTATFLVGGASKIRLGNHQGSKASDDCSKSGCHRPLGNIGTPYSKWN